MTLVDSNVLIDILGRDPRWAFWSVEQLDAARGDGLAVNPIVYAEIAPTMGSAAALDAFLTAASIDVIEPPRLALWKAGAAQGRYRQAGGTRDRVLADFIIGAHAEELGCALLTRDLHRYRTYFPAVRLITP